MLFFKECISKQICYLADSLVLNAVIVAKESGADSGDDENVKPKSSDNARVEG
jgi:hypothetical protein